MRWFGLALSAGLALLSEPLAAATPPAEGAEWAVRIPRNIWLINTNPGPHSGCSPDACEAGLNTGTYLFGVRYTNSPAGRRVVLNGSVRGCSMAFQRYLPLDRLDRTLWQARYERLFGEMVSEMHRSCGVAIPRRLNPNPLHMMILSDE